STNLGHPITGNDYTRKYGFTASNKQQSKFWRADFAAPSTFELKGAPAAMKDFAPSNKIRIWEYGVGDEVELATWMSVKRIGDDSYRLSGNVGGKVKLNNGKEKNYKTEKVILSPLIK
ncbi:MAG: hypothetical protein ACYTFY_13770, partial [Planctomycetota bacterium]